MRGKDQSSLSKYSLNLGSPPHVRERHRKRRRNECWHRITPACAGKTTSCRRLPKGFRGSPPHVRERPDCGACASPPTGITPACAGKTFFLLLFPAGLGDHPRMCGKDVISWDIASRASGSPPHVRERRDRVVLGVVDGGITPACAGKTEPKEGSEKNG